MAQKTTTDAGEESYDEIRKEFMTTKGTERSSLEMDTDGHALSDMDNRRKAPIEAVAKNVVDRYDRIEAFVREFMSNAHTACIQRAKWELRQEGIDMDYDDVRAVLERAREEVDYEPTIVVTRNQNPEDFALKIADNGIGIASHTAYAIRDIGLSGWHDDGTTNGQFGQGTMSGFLPVDHYGEFDMTTWSAITDENYRARWKLTDLDELPGERGSVGTTFTWPYFIDEATEIDMYETVREYAEGMIVPVIYEHYDEDGTQNGSKTDEFPASYIEERYADGSPLVTYEDEFCKVVWSPDNPDSWSTSTKTWCGYQPIDRNDSNFGTNEYSLPSGFDVRVKVEHGPVVHVPDDEFADMVGKVPVSRNRYERLDDEEQDDHVVRADLPDDAIVAPEPTDDRDRFESKHTKSFFRHYAGLTAQKFKDDVADIVENIDGLEELPDLDQDDRELLLSGLDAYIDVYKKNSADRVIDEMEDAFGVTPNRVLAANIGTVKNTFGGNISDDFAQTIGRMKQARLGTVDDEDEFTETVEHMANKVSLAPRQKSASIVSKASRRKKTEAWKVVEESGDDGDVYMAKTLACNRKTALAWELHEDNQIVVVDSYTKWESMFDWKKLKDLPSRNFDEHIDGLDDDFVDKWDPSRASTNSGSSSSQDLSSMGYNQERAKQKSVKVRYSGQRGKFKKKSGEAIFDAMDEDNETLNLGYGKDIKHLVLYKQTDGNPAHAGSHLADSERGVAYAIVTNYVYDYLESADRTHTPDEYEQMVRSRQVDFDWSFTVRRQQASVDTLDENDVFVRSTGGLHDTIEERGLMNEFVNALEDRLEEYGVDQVRSVTFFNNDPDTYFDVLNNKGFIDVDETPTFVGSKEGFRSRSFGYGYQTTLTLNVNRVILDCILPELDRDATEWDHFSPTVDSDVLIDALQELEDAGGFCSTDDDAETPEYVGDGNLQMSEHSYWVEQTLDRFSEATDWYDDDDDGDDA